MKIILAFFLLSSFSVAENLSAGDECGKTTGLTKWELDNLVQETYRNPTDTYDKESAALLKDLDVLYERQNQDPKTAKVIFLGEIHNIPQSQLGNQMIINSLAKPGDLVLLEGSNAGEIVPLSVRENDPRVRALNKGLTVVGWDSLGHAEEGLQAQRNIKKIHPDSSDDLSEEPLRDRLDAAAKKDANSAETLRAMTDLGKQRMETKKYNYQMRFERNRALIETIRRAQKKNPRAKIFVIAGYNHFTSVEGGELRSFLKDQDSSVLSPRTEIWKKYVSKKATEKYKARIDNYLPYRSTYSKNSCSNILYDKVVPFPPFEDIPASGDSSK